MQDDELEFFEHKPVIALAPFSQLIHEIMAEQGNFCLNFEEPAIIEMRESLEDHLEFLFAGEPLFRSHPTPCLVESFC